MQQAEAGYWIAYFESDLSGTVTFQPLQGSEERNARFVPGAIVKAVLLAWIQEQAAALLRSSDNELVRAVAVAFAAAQDASGSEAVPDTATGHEDA